LRLYATDGRGHGITTVSLSDVRRVEILRFSEGIVAVGIDCGADMERYEIYVDLPEKEHKKGKKENADICMQAEPDVQLLDGAGLFPVQDHA